MLLYIIRHGEPNYETDTLTELGKLQAEAVGRRLFEAGIDRVFSSPLGRARETAEPLCRLSGLKCTVEEWAREIDVKRMLTPVPDGEPKSISLVQNTYFRTDTAIELPYSRQFEADCVCDSEMREVCADIERNGDAFLERLGYKREGNNYRVLRANEERVALFCHGAMGRAWIATLLGIPIRTMWPAFNYTHTGVTVLQFKNNENGLTAPRCLVYSDMSHIYADLGTENMLYNSKTKI